MSTLNEQMICESGIGWHLGNILALEFVSSLLNSFIVFFRATCEIGWLV